MRSWCIVAMGVIVMALTACGHAPASRQSPLTNAGPIGSRVDVLESEIDLGTFDEFASPVAVIVFRNTGDETLELSGPRFPGVSTAASEPLRIEPMGSLPVEIPLDFVDLGPGVHERRAFWSTNDARQTTVVVTLEVEVGPSGGGVARVP